MNKISSKRSRSTTVQAVVIKALLAKKMILSDMSIKMPMPHGYLGLD